MKFKTIKYGNVSSQDSERWVILPFVSLNDVFTQMDVEHRLKNVLWDEETWQMSWPSIGSIGPEKSRLWVEAMGVALRLLESRGKDLEGIEVISAAEYSLLWDKMKGNSK